MPTRNDGRAFERAVHRFVQALGPGMTIEYDYKTPDRDTGTLRQCDVWIEGRFHNHFPIKYLISCKDKGRKLSIDDIGAFKSQIDSTGASSGAIYSQKGFYKPAIEKAKALGIACCRLYANQPADIPQVVLFPAYAANSSIKLVLDGVRRAWPEARVWGDVFERPWNDGSGDRTLLDVIVEMFHAAEAQAIEDRVTSRKAFPADFGRSIRLSPSEVTISVFGKWRRYRARLAAHLIDGSFSLTDNHFVGQQCTPAIDTWGPHPGKEWEEIPDHVSTEPDTPRVVIMLSLGNSRNVLRDALSRQLLPPEA